MLIPQPSRKFERDVELAQKRGFENVSLIKAGLWSTRSRLRFSKGLGAKRHDTQSEAQIAVESLEQMDIPEKITFIKMLKKP